jgi:hypothetical protein
MQKFRVKITAAANEVYGSWRENEHDDLVLYSARAALRHHRTPSARIQRKGSPDAPFVERTEPWRCAST